MEKGTYGDGKTYNVIKIIPSASSTKQDWFWNSTVAGNGIPSTSHIRNWKNSQNCHGARPGESELADGIWVRKVSAQLTVAGDRVVIRNGSSAGDIILDLGRGVNPGVNIYGVASSDATMHTLMRGNADLSEITYDPPILMKPYLHDSSPNNCTFGGGSSRSKCWVKIEVDDTKRQP